MITSAVYLRGTSIRVNLHLYLLLGQLLSVLAQGHLRALFQELRISSFGNPGLKFSVVNSSLNTHSKHLQKGFWNSTWSQLGMVVGKEIEKGLGGSASYYTLFMKVACLFARFGHSATWGLDGRNLMGCGAQMPATHFIGDDPCQDPDPQHHLRRVSRSSRGRSPSISRDLSQSRSPSDSDRWYLIDDQRQNRTQRDCY
ncbi:hypothetical protein JRO89_XS03G0329300 [Xanthoceras sorbifolium]|uniref:Uncharacterized protein n=1 Tax=Xanthoceras sorbifolium TaxID=99658 RepID=A0ABQ8IDV3_9ROSI|nr:hypothetical protein JRO89_XS03G0329300 [Xanthoceras sorbifolium]